MIINFFLLRIKIQLITNKYWLDKIHLVPINTNFSKIKIKNQQILKFKIRMIKIKIKFFKNSLIILQKEIKIQILLITNK